MSFDALLAKLSVAGEHITLPDHPELRLVASSSGSS